MEPYQTLEVEFGKWAHVENVVACASGSAALHLALEALQLPPGSEVVTADFNMIAVPRAITLASLVPVFVDCGDDLLMDPELVSEQPDSTRSLIAVHIYGRRCNMERLAETAQHLDLVVIEDLAEAHGVPPHPETDAACWSFYRNKAIHGEEGGAVAFRDPQRADLAKRLRCLGFTELQDYMHVPRGWNHRLSNAHASLILDSLREADNNLRARRQIEGWYDAHCPDEWRMPKRDVVWIFDVRIPGITREDQRRIVQALNAAGIAARMGFLPMSEQPEFRNCRVVGSGNALRLSESVFYLPVSPGHTTEADCARAFEVIRRAL